MKHKIDVVHLVDEEDPIELERKRAEERAKERCAAEEAEKAYRSADAPINQDRGKPEELNRALRERQRERERLRRERSGTGSQVSAVLSVRPDITDLPQLEVERQIAILLDRLTGKERRQAYLTRRPQRNLQEEQETAGDIQRLKEAIALLRRPLEEVTRTEEKPALEKPSKETIIRCSSNLATLLTGGMNRETDPLPTRIAELEAMCNYFETTLGPNHSEIAGAIKAFLDPKNGTPPLTRFNELKQKLDDLGRTN